MNHDQLQLMMHNIQCSSVFIRAWPRYVPYFGIWRSYVSILFRMSKCFFLMFPPGFVHTAMIHTKPLCVKQYKHLIKRMRLKNDKYWPYHNCSRCGWMSSAFGQPKGQHHNHVMLQFVRYIARHTFLEWGPSTQSAFSGDWGDIHTCHSY